MRKGNYESICKWHGLYRPVRISGGNNALYLGGFIGYSYQGTITACFWDVDTSSQADSAGGTGKATADMKNMTTFAEPAAGRDFIGESINGNEDNWGKPVNANGGYLVLMCQDVPICVSRLQRDFNGDSTARWILLIPQNLFHSGSLAAGWIPMTAGNNLSSSVADGVKQKNGTA